MSDSDLGKLNRYMGGTDDADQFVTVVDDMGKVAHIPVPGDNGYPPTTAKLGESRAGSLALLINSLRKEHGLTFDQAVQMWMLTNWVTDSIPFPPPTGT